MSLTITNNHHLCFFSETGHFKQRITCYIYYNYFSNITSVSITNT